ncbi:MAG: DNA repair protein RecO [Phycisphaerales bacterium]
MPLHSDVAVCVRVWDWSETSQTVSLFSRSLGLLRCLAKGAKRNTTPAFSGGVELLAVGAITAHIKPGRELNILAGWDLTETFPTLRRDLACHYAGLYAAELVQRLAADHDPHPGLFDALLAFLRGLTSRSAVHPALLRFQWAALHEAGYRPALDRLLPSGAPKPEKARAFQFDPSLGGLTAADPPASSAQAQWMLRAATVDALARVGAGESGAAESLEPATGARAARFLAAYLRHVLGAQPATLALVFPDLAAP